MNAAIETHALTKRFKELRSYRDLALYPFRRAEKLAVDGISVTVPAGEVFGLLGPNGAGKTTLIRMLSTALVPTSGTATVAGHDVTKAAPAVRASIGLVGGEERSFPGRLSARENLRFFAAVRGLSRSQADREIDHLLPRLGLAADADRPFETFSAGMRQKLAIARGLLGAPPIVFMDEPTRALDPISAREVRSLVTDYLVRELGRTVLLATHVLSEAEELCDRVALVKAGRVVALGPVDELRRALRPGIRCDLTLRRVPPGLEAALLDLPDVLGLEVVDAADHPLVTLTLTGDGPPLAAALRETMELGGEIFRCELREPSLEDVYLDWLDTPLPRAEVGR
jgi:ABC-2 type transport system ATP-binding protein